MNKKERYASRKKRLLRRGQKNRRRSPGMVLLVLWLGAFLLLGFMIFKWRNGNSSDIAAKNKTKSMIFVDDVLLSSEDLKLENTSSLINISLNTARSGGRTTDKEVIRQPKINQVELYDNVLKQKIKKAKIEDYSDGFAIKPLPE